MPTALFDSVIDNLLQNALEKRKREPGVEILVCRWIREGAPWPFSIPAPRAGECGRRFVFSACGVRG